VRIQHGFYVYYFQLYYMIKLYFSCFLVHSPYNVIMIVYIGYLHSLRFHFLKWEVKYWSIEINPLCWETVHFLFQNIWYKQKSKQNWGRNLSSKISVDMNSIFMKLYVTWPTWPKGHIPQKFRIFEVIFVVFRLMKNINV
jgi:hypothetical protein